MIDLVHCIANLGVGGAQSMAFELYKAIEKYYPQYNQHFLTEGNRPTDETFVSSYGIEYRKMPQQRQIAERISYFKNPVVLYHKLASSRCDLLKDLKKRNIPVIVIHHTFYNSRDWAKADKKVCDIMVAVSDHMEKHVRNWYPRMKRYCYIHNGVNQFRYENIDARKREKNVLITGRINRLCGWKHSEQWIKWVKDVNLPIRMVHDYMGGKINQSPGTRSKERVINGRTNSIRMIGNISDFNTKVSIIKSWDLFLYETNREEGISMAILEAMACGVPVICSNHFGNKEIIKSGVNGYIFKDKTEAKAILTRLCKRPDELKKLKKSTKRYFLEKLDAKHVAKMYIQIVEKLSTGSLGNSVSELFINEVEKEDKTKGPEGEVVRVKEPEVNKKFTILSSCFNKGKYLTDCLNSILAQKYRPLEAVIANDASTDNSGKVLAEFTDKFKVAGIEYRVVNNFSRMCCGSSYRNLAGYISGSYCGILDSDDMLVDDAVEYIMGVYNKYPNIAWIYTQFEICDMQMRRKRRGFCNYSKEGLSLLEMGDKRIHGYGHWRTFNYKIKKPAKLFGKSLTCAVDKHMGYRLEEIGPGMFIDRVCYRYRQHPIGSPESVSSTKHAIEVWKKVRRDAHKRRKKKEGQKYYPVQKGE